MERTVKIRDKVDYKTYTALKEVEKEYREILEDAVNYGLSNKKASFVRIKAGIYETERDRHKDLPSHYIYTTCEDASERLKSFKKAKKRGRAYTNKPLIKNVTVHLDDHLWKLSLDKIEISTKHGRVQLSPFFPKIFWKYYHRTNEEGWKIASEARFKLLKGNIVELYIVFKRDEPKPYDAKDLLPVDLNEDSVSILIDGEPLLIETNTKKITLGYDYKRRKITTGKSTKSREVKRKR